MRKVTNRVAAVVLSTLMVPALPVTVHAEEAAVRNFEYYLSLSDYEVYTEFCTEMGISAMDEASLDETKLPCYDALTWYVFPFEDHSYAFNTYTVHCDSVLMTDGLCETLGDSPELFGFPENWSKTVLADGYDENGNALGTVETTDSLIRIEPYNYILAGHHTYNITIDFDRIAEFEEGYTENAYRDSIYDCYRVMLTLKHSELMADYGIPDRDIEIIQIGIMGDPNAGEETTEPPTDTEPLYGDLNRDGLVNASDAACILEYAAAVGAGFTGTLEDFIFSNE